MREFNDKWLVVAREAKTQYMATLGKDFGGANLDGTMPPITAGPNAVARPGQAAA